MPALPALLGRDQPGDDDGWIVLIGDGADGDQALEFLSQIWPDVKCSDC
jgi:hypothetical protein